MALTDLQIKNAKAGPKPYKLAAGGGMYLLIQPNGSKLWRLKYRVVGVEKLLALGSYPQTRLAEATKKRDEARKLIADGRDPSAQRKIDKLTRAASQENTFSALADELIERKIKEKRAASTVQKVTWLLDKARKVIGNRPIAEVTPMEIVAILKQLEASGHLDTAKRARTYIAEVFRLAIQSGRAIHDATSALKGVTRSPKHKPRPALTDRKAFGELLRAIDSYPMFKTRVALQLMALLFPRPGELRQAEWREFDVEKAVWTVPAERMKMRREYKVPLPRQALAILEGLRVATGNTPYLFPGRDYRTVMSDGTTNKALRSLGYDKNTMVSHGFRSTASSLINESLRFNKDVIEASLSHQDTNQIRAIYNRTDYWDERVKMAQFWADDCDKMRVESV